MSTPDPSAAAPQADSQTPVAAEPAPLPRRPSTTESGPLAEARASAREQLEAAWQLHVDHVTQELEKGWREQISSVLEDRFAEIEAAVQTLADEQTAARLARERIQWTRTLTERWSQTLRRLMQAETHSEWKRVLLDAASAHAGRVMLLKIVEDEVVLDGAVPAVDAAARVPVERAPAIRHAAESRDTTVAIPSAGELSPELAALAPAELDNRIALFPIISARETVAVLTAQGGAEFPALELLAIVASAALERLTPEGGSELEEVAQENPGSAAAWTGLSRQEQERHLRARRYARVHVAELRLYKSQLVKQGRSEANIYGVLRAEIDAGRAIFEQEHMADCPSMADYYHMEIVRTLANDDETLLGPEYPGPLA